MERLRPQVKTPSDQNVRLSVRRQVRMFRWMTPLSNTLTIGTEKGLRGLEVIVGHVLSCVCVCVPILGMTGPDLRK